MSKSMNLKLEIGADPNTPFFIWVNIGGWMVKRNEEMMSGFAYEDAFIRAILKNNS